MTTQHTWTEAEVLRHPQEVCRLLAERDELFEALRYMVKAQSQPFDHADRRAAMDGARAALAKVGAACACNAHDELVAALRDALLITRDIENRERVDDATLMAGIAAAKLEAALAKAEAA